MAFYSSDLVDNVRDANDIVDVIGQYVSLRHSGSNYSGLCPFHSEKSPSFMVSREKQIFKCFGCGVGGDVFSFLQKYDNVTFAESIEILAQRAGIPVEKRQLSAGERAKADERTRLLKINREAGIYYYHILRGEGGKRALDYFMDRGLDIETMNRFGLGYTGARSGKLYRHLREQGYDDALLKKSGLFVVDEERGIRDKFYNRAMFPIMDANSRIIAFGGRVMGDGKPKYINSPETPIFNKSRTLYGLQFARKTRRNQFILCEGYMDVIALHRAGFDNAIAALGTSLTEGHAAIIRRYTTEILLNLDSDEAGKKAALRAIPILKNAGVNCRVINVEPYKDPDELIRAEGAQGYENRIRDAEPSFIFRVRAAGDEYDLRDPQGRTDFERRTADMLLEFETLAERENYLDAVCRTFGLPVTDMRSMIRHEAAIPDQGRKPAGRIRREQNRVNRPPGRRHDIKKKDVVVRSEEIFLSLMAEHPDLYKDFEEHIKIEDFTGDVMRRTADLLFHQIKEKGAVKPAQITGAFENEEEQAVVAGVFAAEAAGLQSEDDVKRAARDVFFRIKRASLAAEREKLDPSDTEGYVRFMAKMKELKGLESKMKI